MYNQIEIAVIGVLADNTTRIKHRKNTFTFLLVHRRKLKPSAWLSDLIFLKLEKKNYTPLEEQLK